MKTPAAFCLVLAVVVATASVGQSVPRIASRTASDSLLLRAWDALDRGGLPDSLVRQLRAVVRDARGPHTADALGILGRHYALDGRLASLDTVLRLLEELPGSDARMVGDRHLLQAESYGLHGHVDSALAHLGRALLLRERDGDWAGVVEVYDAHGRVTERLVGDPGGALAYYTRAVATGRTRAPQSALIAIALLRCGHMASRLGQTVPALDFYQQADTAALRLGLNGVSALARYHLGEVRLQRQGQVQPAAAELHRAVDAVGSETGPYATRALLLAHQLLGDIHYQYGSSHDSALAAYERALVANDAADLSALLIGAYRNAGIIHAWWQRDARAQSLLRQATQLADRSHDEDLAASNRGHWITALIREGDLGEAMGALEVIRTETITTGDGTLAAALGAMVQAVDRDSSIAFDPTPWAAALGTPATMDGFFRSAVDMALARDDIESVLFALFEYGRSLQADGQDQQAQRTFRSAWNQAARKGRDDERRALDRLIIR